MEKLWFLDLHILATIFIKRDNFNRIVYLLPWWVVYFPKGLHLKERTYKGENVFLLRAGPCEMKVNISMSE